MRHRVLLQIWESELKRIKSLSNDCQLFAGLSAFFSSASICAVLLKCYTNDERFNSVATGTLIMTAFASFIFLVAFSLAKINLRRVYKNIESEHDK